MMMALRKMFLLGSAVMLIAGCSTAPKKNIEEQKVIVDSKDAKVTQELDKKITCLATMNCEPGAIVKCLDEGRILEGNNELPSDFVDSVVLESEREYYINGKTERCKFEVIYSGIKRTSRDAYCKKDAELGVSTGTVVGICARASSLEAYLVSCSKVIPIKKGKYWYYFPGMYVATEMKWLSFKPVEYDSFRSMYDHATTGEEALGLTKFNWWSLLKTSLGEYPVLSDDGTSTQVLNLEDMPLRLYYQKGFLKYLQDEYKLKDPIYLYLQITGINGFDKEYKCYVRDFSLIPPEAIVNERIVSVNNQSAE
jgi:hypothetical protein